MMDPTSFSDEVKSTINQFRQILKKQKTTRDSVLLDDDLILYKFLKARNFNLDQSARMLRKVAIFDYTEKLNKHRKFNSKWKFQSAFHIGWRKAYQIDRILIDHKPLEVLEKYMPNSFLGFSKDGCPVRYKPFGNVDMDGIFKSATFQDILKWYIHSIETDIKRTLEQSKKLNKSVSQFVYIYDLDNLTLAKALDRKSLEHLNLGATIFQDNYPERLNKAIIINAPSIFTLSFAIVKTVLAGEVLKKISVYGREGWKDALLEQMDAEVLPAFLGGKRTDPDGDPLCKTFVNHCEVVPEKYFLSNTKQEFSNLIGTMSSTIERNTIKEINVDVDREGSYIEWEFAVKSKDIGFGLTFEFDDNGTKEIEELIAVHKIETPTSTECGRYYCDKKGKYTVIFDNSHSLLTSKEVHYRIEVN